MTFKQLQHLSPSNTGTWSSFYKGVGSASQTCPTCPRGMKTQDGAMGNTLSTATPVPHTDTCKATSLPGEGRVTAGILRGRGTSAGPLAFRNTQHHSFPSCLHLAPKWARQTAARILPCYSLLSPHSAGKCSILGSDGGQSLGDFSPSSHQPKRKSYKQRERRQSTHQGTTAG